jgi:hypothetical protein
MDQTQESAAMAEGPQLSTQAAEQLATHYRASHYSALDFQEQVLVATVDHLTNMFGPLALKEDPGFLWKTVWGRWSALIPQDESSADDASKAVDLARQTLATTLKQLSVSPVVFHHQGTYCAYIMAFALASSAWDLHLGGNPLDPLAGRRLRRLLFEAKAGEGSHLDLILHLLEPESSQPDDRLPRAGPSSATQQLIETPLHHDQPAGEIMSVTEAFFDDGSRGLDIDLPRGGIRGWLWTGNIANRTCNSAYVLQGLDPPANPVHDS